MASFAELLGGASVAALEGAGFEVPEPAEVEDDAFEDEHDMDTDARDDEDWERELREVPAPAPTVRPRDDVRVAGTRTYGVRPQAWKVSHGYSSHSKTQGVFDNARLNDLSYACIAENNCRLYCEGGENWYKLTQLALAGDMSTLVERGYLSREDADSYEPLEAAARAFANAHYTTDMADKYTAERLGEDAPTWEKLRLAYLIACAPAGGWRLAAPSEAVACVSYRVQRSSSFKTIRNKRFSDSTWARVLWACERLNVPSGVDGVVAQRLLYRLEASVDLDWSAMGGVGGRVMTPAGGFTVSTRSDILGVSQAAFSLCQIMSAATARGGYTGGAPGDWKTLEHARKASPSCDKGADGDKAPVFDVHSVGKVAALAVERFRERGLSVFAPEIVNEDGDYVMLYHKPFELTDDCLAVNGGK